MRTASYSFAESSASEVSTESPFYLTEGASEIAVLFRLLSGSCILQNNINENVLILKHNYFYDDIRDSNVNNIDFLEEYEEGISYSDYEKFLESYGKKNSRFYRSYLSELACSIYYEEQFKHTAAFLHLYRAYEKMSFAFPMIYSSKTDDYIGTFNTLKQWLGAAKADGSSGELAFHKSFIGTLFKGSAELSKTIDIEINIRSDYREGVFDIMSKKVLGWDSSAKYTPSSIYPDKISICFVDFHSFFVNLRNRYFHNFSTRTDNISIEEVHDSDLLFSLVNKQILNYVATIYFAMFKHLFATKER